MPARKASSLIMTLDSFEMTRQINLTMPRLVIMFQRSQIWYSYLDQSSVSHWAEGVVKSLFSISMILRKILRAVFLRSLSISDCTSVSLIRDFKMSFISRVFLPPKPASDFFLMKVMEQISCQNSSSTSFLISSEISALFMQALSCQAFVIFLPVP